MISLKSFYRANLTTLLFVKFTVSPIPKHKNIYIEMTRMKCDTGKCKKEAVTNMIIRDYLNRPIIVIRVCCEHLGKLYDSGFFEGEFLKQEKEEAEKLLEEKASK